MMNEQVKLVPYDVSMVKSREEAAFTSMSVDVDNRLLNLFKSVKIKVTEKPDVVVTQHDDGLYYTIKYKEVGRDEYVEGFGSYDAKNCFRWLETEFEVVETFMQREVLKWGL